MWTPGLWRLNHYRFVRQNAFPLLLPLPASNAVPPPEGGGNTPTANNRNMLQHSESVNKDEVQVTLSVKWSEGNQPQRCKVELQKALQTWANNYAKAGKKAIDCTVQTVSEDGRAVFHIKPAPANIELQDLKGQTLQRKNGKTVTITSVSLLPLKTQIPEHTSVNFPPSLVSDPQNEEEQLVEQSSFSSSPAGSAAGEETFTCLVPVGHFWYVNHIYKEEIKRIEKENGVKIKAEVNVTIEADQRDGGPKKALSEFIHLVQKGLSESDGSVIPLKHLDPDKLKDTLKIVQRHDNKLLLALSSEELTVCGPRQSQDAIIKYHLSNATQQTLKNTSNSSKASVWASQDTSLKIAASIKDPLVDGGLIMEESYWRPMTASYNEHISKIKDKFGVDLKESGNTKGKVTVKAHYKRSEGNASMESHAIRALLHLYQKIVLSPMSFTQNQSAMGFGGSPKNTNNVHLSEGAASGPVLNSQSGYSTLNTDTSTGEGATAEDNTDKDCPICMDTFTNKKQLACKHAFCEDCLAQSMKSIGHICPVCKDVFGRMEGDQPDGKMSSHSEAQALPGFPGCGTIVINYLIPDGKQTKKHPNPGKYYSGISRQAYLPDNKEGKEVLQLLRKAFNQKLIFTVGTSRTTGMENQVTWNDIHHKTYRKGGPESFGYPDRGYLSRVREELKAKGIK